MIKWGALVGEQGQGMESMIQLVRKVGYDTEEIIIASFLVLLFEIELQVV